VLSRDVDLADVQLDLYFELAAEAYAQSPQPQPVYYRRAIEETCPLEDRVPDRKVFQGITEASAYQAMSRACRNAKVPHYHPHDLRHRRISIWHQSGVPARELAERAGHARPSMSLDVYSHVMPSDEVTSERFLSLLD